MTIQRSLWSSRFAFIMVTAGAAIGLGNIWKFPYMAGSNGGGVFVVLYLVCILLIGIPAMIAELMIGRRGRQNPVNTLSTLAVEANSTPHWGYLGWLGALTLLIVLSFYSVVAGWSIAYLKHAMQGSFVNASPDHIMQIWTNLLASPTQLIGWHTLFMFLTMGVIALGVNKGIEQASRWMMPALFITLIILVIYAAIEGDFVQAWRFLFSFKMQDITLTAVINAMGQAFFSLATGAGCILIYGSYLSKDTDIVDTVFIVAVLNVIVALLSGLAIFPIVFAHHLTPEGGPGLMFHVLPIAFSTMPGSVIIGSFFFLLLLFAAWTSSISLGEPLVAMLHERRKISRKLASFYVGVLAWGLGLVSVYSFNYWQDIKLFNRWGIFQVITDFPTNILLPLGAFLYCVFAGWIMKKSDIQAEFGQAHAKYFTLWRWMIRTIAPAGILVILGAHLVSGG
jgi:NSS family neurotransmitter:Na+ symporter